MRSPGKIQTKTSFPETVLGTLLIKSGWNLEQGKRPSDLYFFPPGVTRKTHKLRTDYFDSYKQLFHYLETNSQCKDDKALMDAMSDFKKSQLSSSQSSSRSKSQTRDASPSNMVTRKQHFDSKKRKSSPMSSPSTRSSTASRKLRSFSSPSTEVKVPVKSAKKVRKTTPKNKATRHDHVEESFPVTLFSYRDCVKIPRAELFETIVWPTIHKKGWSRTRSKSTPEASYSYHCPPALSIPDNHTNTTSSNMGFQQVMGKLQDEYEQNQWNLHHAFQIYDLYSKCESVEESLSLAQCMMSVSQKLIAAMESEPIPQHDLADKLDPQTHSSTKPTKDTNQDDDSNENIHAIHNETNHKIIPPASTPGNMMDLSNENQDKLANENQDESHKTAVQVKSVTPSTTASITDTDKNISSLNTGILAPEAPPENPTQLTEPVTSDDATNLKTSTIYV